MKLYFLLLIFLISPLFAYLDPGSGSMLLYFLAGIIATFIYFIKGIIYKVKSLFSSGKIDVNTNDLQNADILFYSEGGHYWNVFLPIIEELEKLEVESVYYTSQENDPSLKSNFSFMKVQYIGNNYASFALLNNIKVKVVIMTTPQLDIMYLKKSKYVQYYIHIVHAASDLLLYKKFAFDYFDIIMCSGEHQIDSIRALEQKRNLPEKLILRTGLTYYDIMFRNKVKHPTDKQNKTILIAPTWGENGMLTKFGIEPIKKLLLSGYQIILRPHPQDYTAQKQLMEEIEEKLLNYRNLEIDKKLSGEDSMGRSNILISDFSGIIFDYFFIYEKPIIAFFDNIPIGGLEAEDVDKDVWEVSKFIEITNIVKPKDIDKLSDVVEKSIASNVSKKVKNLRCEALFNFPHAGKIAAEQIIKIVKEKS